MKRKGVFVFLGVLSVQLLLTLLVFNPAPHNGGDNAGYITLAHSLLDRGSYQELWDPLEPAHTKYPPVFPLLLAGLMALGVKGWVGLKAIPFVSTLLAGGFTYLWVRGRAGLAMAAGVTLLLVLSQGILYYSHWILSDPTFLALTMGALWSLERAGRRGGSSEEIGGVAGEGTGRESGEGSDGLSSGVAGPFSNGWLSLGFALVILAYFTRSAGLPLVVAAFVWLGVGRRWKPMAGFSAAFFVPAFLWWLRGNLRGGSEYGSEFWFVDPYRPELGRVGPMGLLSRVWENLLDYTTNLIPEGVVGGDGWFLLPLGMALSVLALVGWARHLGPTKDGGDGGDGGRLGGTWGGKAQVAEFFFPLYGGLMLLWPGVWSGDRFALPLFPLLFFYSGAGLLWLLKGLRPAMSGAILGAAFLLVALPALRNWAGEAVSSRSCQALLAASGDPWDCYGVNVREYALMAQWSGENLPPGATIITRKPRIFYLLSGVKALSLPLTTDAGEFLEVARKGGARYLTVDRWDGLASYYLPRVLGERPGSFCYITGVEAEGAVGIQLLGIHPDGEGEGVEEGSLRVCPNAMVSEEPFAKEPVPPGGIPLLVWGSGR